MSSTLAPYGLRPVYHPSGQDRALTPYFLASGYATSLYRGTPVTLAATTQNLNVAAASGADWLGVFWGCEFIDAFGVPQESSYWPASTTVLAGTVVTAYVYDDPLTVYEIQCDGALANTASVAAAGQQLNFSATSGYAVTDGSATLGQSTTAASASSLTATAQGMMRIVDIAREIDNAAGDAYTKILVQVARHMFRANKVAV